MSVTVDEIRSLSGIGQDWCGVEIDPPTVDCIQRAVNVFEKIKSADLTPDYVTASAGPGVALVFTNGDKYADIEVFNDGELLACTSDRKEKGDTHVWCVEEHSLSKTIERIREFIQ